MSDRSQRFRRSSLPHRYQPDGLDFSLDTYSISGRKPRDIDLKGGEFSIDLTTIPPEYGSDEKIQLYGTLEVPETVVEAVFPEGERGEPPARLYVAIRCHDTIFRDSEIVSGAPMKPGTYEVSIPIELSNVRGRVELLPYLIRVEDREGAGRYAESANVKLASGQRYELIVDATEDFESPTIDGEKARFSELEHLPEGDKLYSLDFRNPERPKLWINADNPRIADVLQVSGSVGAEPRMRDVILDQISYGVWSQLIIRTASAIDEDGEVEYEWQRTVMKTFARQMYRVSDLEDAAHLMREEAADPEKFPELFARIDDELQEFLDFRTQLINLMEEGLQI